MKKIYILCSIALGLASAGQAQQSIRFSNYLFNRMIINPAAAGSNDYVEIMGSYRKQWVGFNGSPQTSFLSLDGSALDKRIGLGLQVVDDQMGALNTTGVMGNLAGRVRIADDKWFSAGFGAGWFRNSLNGSELTYQDPNEIAIPASTRAVDVFDFKAGVFYKDTRNFAGVSAFNILRPRINYTGINRRNEGVLARHFYIFAGRVFPLNADLALIPSALAKISGQNNIKNQLDLNAKLSYRGMLAAGISYRNNESVGVIAEYVHKQVWRFSYAFDYNTNMLQNYQNGSHEIMVAYRIINNRQLTENPRYFYNN
ncbi:MAG TPA: type IX secretion system membrane protein PorP/SprF [Luteibaculaceae bacterium]|nr:type IX secretion system membrane protein PorP/SprF [Luteibaculaceae bacterium]